MFDAVEEEAALFLLKVAIGIELFELSDFVFEAKVVIFFEDEGLAAETGEGVEQASEIGEVAIHFTFEAARGEIPEALENLGEGDLEDDLMEFGVILAAEHFDGGLLPGAHLLGPVKFFEPVHIAPAFPFGEVIESQVLGVAAEFFEDGAVGKAIADQEIDPVAEGLGETGDLAIASAGLADSRGRLRIRAWAVGMLRGRRVGR